MKIFQIFLPYTDSAGTTIDRGQWEKVLMEHTGNFLRHGPIDKAARTGEGELRESAASYQIACSEEKFAELCASAFFLFPHLTCLTISDFLNQRVLWRLGQGAQALSAAGAA